MKPITTALFALTASFTLPMAATNAQTYPNQPIKIIVPFTPGTGMDTIARVVAPKLSERLGQPVIVQNQAGASGNIGADFVAKAPADGYTVLMGANTMLMAAQIYKNVPFNPVKDFAPVTMAAWGTLMLVAHPKTGLKSMKDLVDTAKAKPGHVNFGSPGVGTPHHMAMELFKAKTSLFMLHVPYRGSAGYTCTSRKTL
jgi:tripartite-type tricarboxylate transporter receptor subunit TctC